MPTFPQDVRHSLRLLTRSPGFTSVALLTLALGIGANTAIFSLARAALLTPLPIPNPERAVMVYSDNPARGWHHVPSSVPDIQDWRSSGIFQSLGAFDDTGFNLRTAGRTERVAGLLVTAETFAVLGAGPQFGRLLEPGDMLAGHDNVVVLGQELWRSTFAADPRVVGRSVVLDGAPRTIVGVLPAVFPKMGHEQIYAPLVFAGKDANSRGTRYLNAIGRLAPGVSLAAARQRLAEVSEILARQYPEDAGTTAVLQPVEEAFVEDVRPLVLVLFGAVGFVLLIACANLANLLLARGIGREKEIAVRAALGAGRGRLVCQLLAESSTLALLGGLLGVVPAFWGVDLIASFQIEGMLNPGLLRVDGGVLAFNVVLSIATGILFGLVPAWQISRTDVNRVLNAGRSAGTRSQQRLRTILVGCEVALTLVLLAGAGLMLESFMRLRSASPGYNSHGVATMRLVLGERQYDTAEKKAAWFAEVLRRLRAIPGVREAGGCDELPTSDDVHASALRVDGRPEPPPGGPDRLPIVLVDSASAAYFQTLQVPLIAGRLFKDSDRAGAPLVALVDAVAAAHNWPRESPIGKFIRLEKSGPSRQVVGVVGAVQHNAVVAMLKKDLGQVYLPLAQAPRPSLSIALRTDGDPAALLATAARIVHGMDSDQPVFQQRTLDQARSASRAPQSLATLLLAGFALTALLLAAVGIYGVVANGFSRRMREIGIRLALGAGSAQVMRQILSEDLISCLAGLAAGLAGAVALTRALSSLLYGVKPGDPLALASVSLLLCATAALASYVPARRALRSDPVKSLRYE